MGAKRITFRELSAVYEAVLPIPRSQTGQEIEERLKGNSYGLSKNRTFQCLNRLADEGLLFTKKHSGYLVFDPTLSEQSLKDRLFSALTPQKRRPCALSKRQVVDRLVAWAQQECDKERARISSFSKRETTSTMPEQQSLPVKEPINAPEIFKVQITGRGMELKMDALEIKFTDEGIFIKK